MKNWYSIQAKANTVAEIAIYDEIGAWGVSAKQFIGDLKAITASTIKLSINSNGGSVFDALAMYNALRQHPANIEVTIMGVAASAASLIAMAGDKIIMPENAFMMIHNPLNMTYGNADDMREMADVLDKIGASLIATYAARTGLPDEEIKALLDAETWMNADEAVSKGFADEIQPALKAVASADIGNLPDNVRAALEAPTDAPTEAPTEDPTEAPTEQPTEAPTLAPAEPDARALAVSIIAKASAADIAAYADVFLLDPAITNEQDADVAITEASTIVKVCAAAKLPDMAAGMIKARIPLATVRNRLIEFKAEMDAATHTNNHIPTGNGQPAAPINVWNKIFPQRQTKE